MLVHGILLKKFITLRGDKYYTMESLILAQNERWQRGLGMQVERKRVQTILRESEKP